MRHTLLAICLMPAIALVAQQAEVTRYDVADGLPQSMVNHVLQDHEGFIWLGTGDGLARFDGQRFVVYKHDPRDSSTLSHNNIWGLAEKDGEHLWVGTRGGLDILDRRNGHSTRYGTGIPPGREGCWTPYGVWQGGQCFYSPLSITLLHIGEQGGRMRRIAHEASYAMHWDEATGTLTQFLLPDTLLTISANGHEGVEKLPVLEGEQITGLVPVGDRWVLLSDRGCWTWSASEGRQALPTGTAAWLDRASKKKTAIVAGDGHIWVSNDGHGVAVLDQALRIQRIYPLLSAEERPLDITTLSEDRQGNIWVGTDGKGVFKIAPQRIKFQRCMPGQGLSWEPPSWFVRGFAQWDQDHMLVNFYQGGFALFNERSQTLVPVELGGLGERQAHDAELIGPWTDKHGTIWLRDHKRVYALEPGTGRSLLHGGSMAGNAIALNEDGEMVVLHPNGLSIMRHATTGPQPLALPSDGLKAWMDSMRIVPDHMAIDPRGRLFLCHTTAPITVWKDGQLLQAGPFHRDVRFTALVPTGKGDLWMTSNDGSYLLDGDDLSVLRHITVHDGLPDQYLYGMLSNGDGTWWIPTNRGLCHFDPRNDQFATYGMHDGLQSMEFNAMALARSASGRSYVGGINGFNHFIPGALQRDPDTAKVAIVGLDVQDSPIDLATWNRSLPLVLPHGRNHVRIDLAVLEFTAPESNSYRYRIEGYSDWRTHPASRPIQLTNLPAGLHVLELAGINADGLVSAPEVLLRIHVPMPFTSSPAFFILMGMLMVAVIGGGAFLIYRRRVKLRLVRDAQEMKELRIRARIAQDLHDDLGSGLARITALARQAGRRLETGGAVPEPVGRLQEVAQDMSLALRDVVWVNDPRGGDLPTTLLRIRDHATDLFEGSGTAVITDFPAPLPERNIGPLSKRNLYLIAKEAIHNASKYSGASELRLRFKLSGGRFELCVQDNGNGLAEGSKGGGHGLRNMQERASQMGCTCGMGRLPEGGFHILLAGPVNALDL